MCNATRGIDAGRGVIRHRGVSDGSDGARPLWRSHSARTEMFFADGVQIAKLWITRRWSESKLANDKPLVQIPKENAHLIDLEWTEDEQF